MDWKVEIIEWFDPYSDDSEWQSVDKIKIDLAMVYSIGHVIKETDEVIVIAHSLGRTPSEKTNECCGMMIIPKKCIKKRRKISVKAIGKSNRGRVRNANRAK